MNHHSIILDLETLSTRTDALITEIGLLAFDNSSFEPVHERQIRPDLFAQLALGRHTCPDTIAFHQRNHTLPTDLCHHVSLPDALFELEDFFYQYPPHHVWIQGPDFDRPILESFLAALGRKLPWDYWRTRDSRTLWDLAFPGTKHPKRPHTALGDCQETLTSIRHSFHKLHPAATEQP